MRSSQRLHCLTAAYRGAEPLQAGAPPAAMPLNVRRFRLPLAPVPVAPRWLTACCFTVAASLVRGKRPCVRAAGIRQRLQALLPGQRQPPAQTTDIRGQSASGAACRRRLLTGRQPFIGGRQLTRGEGAQGALQRPPPRPVVEERYLARSLVVDKQARRRLAW